MRLLDSPNYPKIMYLLITIVLIVILFNIVDIANKIEKNTITGY